MKRSIALAGLLLLAAGRQGSASAQEEVTTPGGVSAEEMTAPTGPQTENPGEQTAMSRVSMPFTPYPAGLSWTMTPQPFRVPIPDRFYYPPCSYVRRCPYYPRGYYWGANWNRHVIGPGNLLHCQLFRFNPYWTAAKAKHKPKLRGSQRYIAPPGPEGQAMALGAGTPSIVGPPLVGSTTGRSAKPSKAAVAHRGTTTSQRKSVVERPVRIRMER
jgi:hypothetical protein